MAKPSFSLTDMRSACPSVRRARLRRGCGVGRCCRTSTCLLASAPQLAFLCSGWAHAAKDSAARSRCKFLTVDGAWLLHTVLALGWTTMVGALDLGPDVAQWKSAVEAASPGTAISFRPGFYHGCNVAIPAGHAARCSFLTNHFHINISPDPSSNCHSL